MLSKGLAYEKIALEYLQNQSLKLISRNYRSRFGEIDLIMQDKQSLVFIEVRFRAKSDFGHAAETVTKKKQAKIIRTAELFLSQHQLWNKPCRFDVVTITADEQIDWLRAAFNAS